MNVGRVATVVLKCVLFVSLASCTNGNSGGSLGAPIAALPGDEFGPDAGVPLAPEPATPVASPVISDPAQITGSTPAEVAAKAAVVEVLNVQSTMNDAPELALTSDDVTELQAEGLLASPNQLEGWVK